MRAFVWQRASQHLTQWQQAGQDGLLFWDERGWEKPESWHSDDLGPTRSSQAACLTHSKPGSYSPPPQQGPPLLAAQRWWTKRGPPASVKREAEGKRLVELAASCGRAVMPVCAQGFARAFWLGLLLAYRVRFLVRWRQESQLLDATGNQRLTWKLAQGKRGCAPRTGWDGRRARWVLARPVAPPTHPDRLLWLLVCRSQGRSPCTSSRPKPSTPINRAAAWSLPLCEAGRSN
jgi:hypothetical protein